MRARVSAITSAIAPPRAEAGISMRWSEPKIMTHYMGNEQADVTDGAADGNGEPGENRSSNIDNDAAPRGTSTPRCMASFSPARRRLRSEAVV